ncbi:hypothetical protein H5410_007414 [Solanum commersonii]|uniref:Transmembrane protein n=1 Tax=Solanum commersonii TaxID=4109 RepID=A0A9J6AD14_SOLCO|nr:hypothetical protein H5410_007414 [Solanum commersonii]
METKTSKGTTTLPRTFRLEQQPRNPNIMFLRCIWLFAWVAGLRFCWKKKNEAKWGRWVVLERCMYCIVTVKRSGNWAGIMELNWAG